jgi:hypothetical protein
MNDEKDRYLVTGPRAINIFIPVGIVVAIFVGIYIDPIKQFIHKIYNMLPPQKATLGIVVRGDSGDILQNRLLVLDGKDSLYTDDDGLVTIDSLHLGEHTYAVLYEDSVHNHTMDLKKDVLANVTMHIAGKDEISDQPIEQQSEHAIALAPPVSPKSVSYPVQWFKLKNTLQFGNVCVRLVGIDTIKNTINVNICYSLKEYVCDDPIIGNAMVNKDIWYGFEDRNINYKLILQKIDTPSLASNELAAYVSMQQISK